MRLALLPLLLVSTWQQEHTNHQSTLVHLAVRVFAQQYKHKHMIHLTVTLLPNQSYKPPSSVHLSAQLDFYHQFCSGKVAGHSRRQRPA